MTIEERPDDPAVQHARKGFMMRLGTELCLDASVGFGETLDAKTLCVGWAASETDTVRGMGFLKTLHVWTGLSCVLGSSQPMKARIWRFDNANSLYYALIDEIASAVRPILDSGRSPVVALPTGNTMIPFYRLAVESEERLGIQDWTCFNLDEYHPLPSDHAPYSFKNYLDQHFYSRLIQPPRLRMELDGTADHPEEECLRFEKAITDRGGIDLVILGIGTNGHIAFNEPGSTFDSRTRLVHLHPDTLFSNFKGAPPVTSAITLGIGTLLEARKAVIVAMGKSKAQAVRSAISDPPGTSVPASALQSHPNVTWMLDQESSSLI
jgi:glucosamine-6-phosphate deaminase